MVSIVLPVYNAAATIEAAVNSCLKQSFRDFELLLVDDGSTDETASILKRLSGTDSRIRIISIPHSGIASAMNTGMENAKGKYIARMDADDEMFPHRIEKQFHFLEANPECGLVSSLVKHGGDPQKQEGYAAHINWINSLITPEEILLNRFVESPVCNPSVLFRKELIQEYGACREGDFPEDYEIWLRWLDAGVRMEKIPEVLLTWNDLPGRLTRNDPRYSAEAFEKAKTIYLAKFIREQEADKQRSLFLCGAGRITRKKSDFLIASGLNIGGYIDIDPKKIGKMYNDLPVISLDELPAKENAYVVSYVSNRGAREAIRKILKEKGFEEGKDFILAG